MPDFNFSNLLGFSSDEKYAMCFFMFCSLSTFQPKIFLPFFI